MAPLPSVRARRVGARLGLLALVAALVTASLAVGGPSPSAASSSDADRAPAEASSGHGSPLSPRLQALSRPAVASLSLPGRAAALDVAATGPMSLLYDNEDRVLVTARVTATDPSTVDGVEAAGAVVTFVDPTQRSITMRVSPAALPALATVPGLEYVREELAPLRNATCPTGSCPKATPS